MGEPKIKEYITIEEAAEMLHMGVSTIRKKIAEGLLPASKPGKRVIIRLADIHLFAKRFKQ